MKQEIALLGLGNLGVPIAEKLIEAGYLLKIWNRTTSKADTLLKAGAVLAASPEDAIVSGGIVITVLADDKVLEAVVSEQIVQLLGSGGLHISISTISPQTSRRLYALHKSFGSHYVAAPIFARPEAIRTKVGNICLSGDAHARDRAKSIIQHFAKGIFDFGDEPGAAIS